VMQAARARAADVHAGPFPERFEALEDLHVPGAIGATSLRQRAPFKRMDLLVFGRRLTRSFAG
jgi:hypothetical protein